MDSKENNTEKSGQQNLAFELGSTDIVQKGENGQIQQTAVQETKERQQWGNGLEFLMSCIAMSVGLGNIWRFPFTAQANGGGAFLIPYIIVLTLIGRPLYYMEMGLGQFSSRGPIQMFTDLSPVLRGVGYAQVIGSACVATYYCSLMALTLFYFIHSFTNSFPWANCLDSWNDYLDKKNMTCIPATGNFSGHTNDTTPTGSSELWFRLEVLQETDNIVDDGIGLPEWRLTLCLLGSWAITYIVIRRGVSSSGKFSYFLALFPYVIMITLLIKAATLEGAGDGMFFFIDTEWEKLLDPEVWYNAVTQCFFSLNVAFGSIIMYSSYNEFRHNINRDALVVTTLDTFTSLLSGCTVFGILGNLAFQLELLPEEVLNGGGTGLAFISYPDAISKFDSVPWLFALLFFFMLFVLGVGSLVALQSSVNTAIHDAFPSLAMWKISLITGCAGFLIGLMYVCPGGQFMLNLVDYFGGTFIIYMLAIVEVAGVTWFYGAEEFCQDMEFMLKIKMGIYWRVTWLILMPVLLIIIFIYFLVKMKRLQYDNKDYPDGILSFGWLIVAVTAVQMILWAVYYIYVNKELGYPQMCKKATSHEKWGPKDPTLYEEWKTFKEEARRKKQAQNKSWLRNKFDFIIYGR